jgi:predicted flavoprotein YhiN
MQPGDSVVVYGAGPVGLMAAYSAMIQGASKVKGKIAFDMGKFWFKGQKVGTGQGNVRHYPASFVT